MCARILACPKSSISITIQPESPSSMWNLQNTGCSTLSAWATPHPLAASTISFDDRHHHDEDGHLMNPSSSSPCEDDASISTSSFTNASGHSVLSAESSHQPLAETTASSSCDLMNGGDHNSSHDHLWSHFLLSNIDTCEDLHKCDPDVRENLLGVVPVMKGASTDGILEQAACDYLKKLENTYCNNPSDKDFFGSGMSSFVDDSGRLSKVSDSLFGDWSTATPHESDYMMHVLSDYAPRGMVVGMDSNRYPCIVPDNPNIESEKPHRTAAGKYAGTVRLHHNGNKVGSCGSARSLSDLISVSSRLISEPSLDVKVLRPGSSPNMKKQGPKSTSLARDNEGKRKRSDRDSSSTEKLKKKHGHGNSKVTSSSKVPVPKVKLGDRIATLQQIVSPFGKTDTASVLMEAMAYIKFLQEQVQLLISNPYMKTHPHREYPWGGNEVVRLLDLRSRGLCLIPISCAPQVCRDNTGCDYWTPPYRGVFYR